MGKVGEEQPIPTSVSGQNSEQNAENDCRIKGFVGFRCVFVLLLGVAVLLSAVFWLPPFFRHGDPGDLDLASLFRGGCSFFFTLVYGFVGGGCLHFVIDTDL